MLEVIWWYVDNEVTYFLSFVTMAIEN